MKAEPFVRGVNFGEGVRWHEGRFWYSDFYKHQVSSAEPGPPRAPIMRVTPDGKASIASPDHLFPNGMAIIDGGKTLIAAECFIPGLTAFDLASDGTLSNRRIWAQLSKAPPSLVPDGI